MFQKDAKAVREVKKRCGKSKSFKRDSEANNNADENLNSSNRHE